MANTLKASKWLKSLGIGLAIVLVCCGASCAAPSDSGTRTFDYKWPMNHKGDEWITLRIPRGYGSFNAVADAMEKRVYPNGRPTSDLVEESLLLEALWPEMSPRTEETRSEFEVPGGGRSMHVLMHSGAIDSFKATNPLMDGEHYNALQHHLKMSIEDLKHVCIAPPVLFNPDGTRNHAVCHDRERPDEKPSRFGLKRMGVDFTKYPDLPKEQYIDLFKNDIYYAPDVGEELQTVISCDAEEVDVNARKSGPISPQCQHFFIFKPFNANVSIGYRRVYLKDWRAIQTAWEKLLQSIVVETQTDPASTTGRK